MSIGESAVWARKIVAVAKHQLAVERGEIEVIEVDSDDDRDNEQDTPEVPSAQVRSLCEQLEAVCIGHGGSLELQSQLRQFRGLLRCDEILNAKQVRINTFLTPKEKMEAAT
ncbi:hypothetical protein DFH09DRAFT_1104482 [Mycena vulgaris]|nr:hypothetical protein DFH09DRAFT_1104482 [Mycena vulgaris]